MPHTLIITKIRKLNRSNQLNSFFNILTKSPIDDALVDYIMDDKKYSCTLFLGNEGTINLSSPTEAYVCIKFVIIKHIYRKKIFKRNVQLFSFINDEQDKWLWYSVFKTVFSKSFNSIINTPIVFSLYNEQNNNSSFDITSCYVCESIIDKKFHLYFKVNLSLIKRKYMCHKCFPVFKQKYKELGYKRLRYKTHNIKQGIATLL